jgi:hypothetical protein
MIKTSKIIETSKMIETSNMIKSSYKQITQSAFPSKKSGSKLGFSVALVNTLLLSGS